MTHPRFPPPPRRLPAPAPPPRRCWPLPDSSCPARLRFARLTYVLPSLRFLSLPPLLRCWLCPCSLKPLTTAGIPRHPRSTAATVVAPVAVAAAVTAAVAARYLPPPSRFALPIASLWLGDSGWLLA